MSRYIVCHYVESTGLDKTKDQIIQIAFPTGTTVTEFETKLNTIKAL